MARDRDSLAIAVLTMLGAFVLAALPWPGSAAGQPIFRALSQTAVGIRGCSHSSALNTPSTLRRPNRLTPKNYLPRRPGAPWLLTYPAPRRITDRQALRQQCAVI